MINRRKILEGGVLAALVVGLPLGRRHSAYGASAPAFDYYISPTGDDNNAGTLASPWSITALNSKKSTYAGKRIGLIAGTYQHGTAGGAQTTLFSMYQQPNPNKTSILALEGGPSGTSPTYLASCDASGNYSARAALIDCSDPATGNLPTVEGEVLGQYAYQANNVTQFGNVTVDGIRIKNFTFSALIFYGPSANSINNVIIKNCELFNGTNVQEQNNPGVIFVRFAQGLILNNCLIHDFNTNPPGPGGLTMNSCGYIQFDSYGTLITNCTFYGGILGCCSLSQKDGHQQMWVSYCYLDWGNFGSAYTHAGNTTNLGGTVHNYDTGVGLTNNFHHNIVLGPILGMGESGGNNQGTVNFYNNTFYQPQNTAFTAGLAAYNAFIASTQPTGNYSWYNNIVWSDLGKYDNNSYSAGTVNFPGADSRGTLTTCDHNVYGQGCWFNGLDAYGPQEQLTAWQARGFDTHSVQITSTPFVSKPTALNPSSFTVKGPAATAGVGGAICGAMDGTGLIGCDFVSGLGPIPNPPSLIVS